MGIERGGDAEYEEFEPSYEEKAEKLEATLKPLLEESPDSLKLSGKYIATDEVKIIGNYSLMKSVRSLDLSDNQINDEALLNLFESDILCGLEELYLQINFLTGKGLSELAQSEKIKIKNLKVLVLSDNRLSDSSIAEMLLSNHFQNLESLDIGWNEAGNETAKSLSTTTTFSKLKKLEMERSYVDEEGFSEFIKGELADQLEELDISANKIKDESIKILAQAPKWKSLKTLRISQNRFGNEGAKALGESVSMSGLIKLYAGRNYFDAEGAQAIYESKTLKKLKTLVIKEEVDDGSGLVNYSRPELLRPDDPNAI
jgi:Ran GTPase-activating protein (RanGAP) involved in mRNA processing and transport